MDSIITIFEEQVRIRPHAIAIRCGNKTLSYSQLNEKSNQLAHYIHSRGIKPDMAIALCMERSLSLLVAIFGILKAGGAYVPLDPSHPVQRLFYTLQDNDNPLLLVHNKFHEKFKDYSGTVLIPDEEVLSQQPIHNPEFPVQSDNLAYIIYTSGSTGKPKGVLVEHQSVVNYAAWFADYCGCQPLDVIDFSANYVFDMSISVSIVPMMLGLTIQICDDETKKDPALYLQYLQSCDVNIIKITPGYLQLLLHTLKHQPMPLPALRQIILGGENLPKSACISWLSRYPEQVIYNEYGPTEATIAVTQQKITSENMFSMGLNIPIGKTGPHITCYILDKNNQLLPSGEKGELHIAGICLARGYLNKPEFTAARFIETPFCEKLYKTGDLCSMHPDGTVEYFGRLDDQIKIRGFRIEPEEISQVLMQHPAIESAVVFSPDEGLKDRRLIAWYIEKPACFIEDPKALQQWLQQFLPDYMIPSGFVRMDHFPLTANNKLDKHAFPVPEQRHVITKALHTDVEKKLAHVWAEELSIDAFNPDDNFFDLGGHSLGAARVVSQIHHIFGKNIALKDFYEAPTIGDLALRIQSAGDLPEHTVIPLEDDKPFALGNFQFLLWASTVFAPKARKLNLVSRKRFTGTLDINILTLAFKAILKKHEVLMYRLLKFKPAQLLNKDATFTLKIRDLQAPASKRKEALLNQAIVKLARTNWTRHQVFLKASLFQLDENCQELHIALPHIIADEMSMDILWTDLSLFYLALQKDDARDLSTLSTDTLFRVYIQQEQQYMQTFLDRDIAFWESWLKGSSLFSFPAKKVITNMNARGIPYSSWIQLSDNLLDSLQKFCIRHQLNMHDSICAALSLALFQLCEENNQNIFLNIVKSTRDDPEFDDTIGCFLRLEPVRIDLNKKSTLQALTRQIRKSSIEALPYQGCASLVKLACVGIFQKKALIKPLLSRVLTRVYSSLFPISSADQKIMSMAYRLAEKSPNHFLININIQNSFQQDIRKENLSLFGLPAANLTMPNEDLLKIDNFFDAVFLSDKQDGSSWMVISANLEPAFRLAIGKKFVEIINKQNNRAYLHSSLRTETEG